MSNYVSSLNPAVRRCPHHSPVSRALQKLLCPLYPAWQLCCAPPSFLQSLPHPDSQSSASLALLKLPLGNLTPYTKPEMPEVPTHAHRRTHACMTQTHAGNSLYFKCGVHLAFILPAPSSVSEISGGSLIGDLLCRSQSPSNVAKGEWDPLFSSSFLQTKHPHAGYPASPWGLYCILPLSQPSIAASAPGLSFLLFTFLLIHANVKWYFVNVLWKLSWHFKQMFSRNFSILYNSPVSLCQFKYNKAMPAPLQIKNLALSHRVKRCHSFVRGFRWLGENKKPSWCVSVFSLHLVKLQHLPAIESMSD